jgi:hypothetical protein
VSFFIGTVAAISSVRIAKLGQRLTGATEKSGAAGAVNYDKLLIDITIWTEFPCSDAEMPLSRPSP